jgi:hypothetical protein
MLLLALANAFLVLVVQLLASLPPSVMVLDTGLPFVTIQNVNYFLIHSNNKPIDYCCNCGVAKDPKVKAYGRGAGNLHPAAISAVSKAVRSAQSSRENIDVTRTWVCSDGCYRSVKKQDQEQRAKIATRSQAGITGCLLPKRGPDERPDAIAKVQKLTSEASASGKLRCQPAALSTLDRSNVCAAH